MILILVIVWPSCHPVLAGFEVTPLSLSSLSVYLLEIDPQKSKAVTNAPMSNPDIVTLFTPLVRTSFIPKIARIIVKKAKIKLQGRDFNKNTAPSLSFIVS